MSFEITAAQAAQAVSAVNEINAKIEDRISRMGRSGVSDETILGAINKASAITSAVLQYAQAQVAQGETFDTGTVLTIPFDRPKRSRIEAAFRGVLGPKSLAALSAFVEDDVDDGLNIDTAALAAMGIEV